MQIPVSARFLTALVAISSFLSPQQPDEEVRVRPDLDALTASWRAVHGDSWRTFVDWETGHLQMLAGGNAEPPFTPAGDADADWAELALAYVALTEGLFGVEHDTLRFDYARLLPFGQYGSTDKMTVRFTQELDGVPVVGGFTNVLMDMGGRLLSVQSVAQPRLVGTSTTPTITSGFAATTAEADFEARTRLVPTSTGQPELVIHQHQDAGLRQAVLAWQVEVRADVPDTRPDVLRFWIDAQSGAVLAAESQVHDFDVGGNVQTMASPGTLPDEGSNPEAPLSAPRLRVTSSAGTTFTDDNGDFNYPGVNGPLSCTFEYVGTFADVLNIAGSDYSFSQSLSGTGNVVTMNPSPTELVTAQSNTFVHVNVLRDWIRSVVPGDSTADFQVDANCNRDSNCNAYFDGSSINFYTSGGGCVNTAYSAVVVHEEGHWLNVLYGTGNGSSGIGEGNADVFATYLYDDPIMGRNFCGPGCFVRDGNNTRQFCGDCCVGCHGGVHNNGEVWMGATWKVRTNLKNTHGTALGGDIADLIFLGWMNAYDQSTITSIMETQWLTLDDDDGNIGNGTPNFGDIDAGYRQQGFPGVDLDEVIITNVTDLPDTPDELGPYQVNATIVAQVNPPLQVANLRWRANGGSYSTIALNGTGGDNFTAAIPNVPSPAVVEYYIEATDNNGSTATFPSGAPGDVLDFKVGVLTVFFFNDFEGGTDEGWSGGAAGDDATTGVWVRGDPLGTSAQPENDHTTPPGTLCWFTGQGTGGSVGENDVDGGTTTLLSPVFDAAGLANAEISYWRWYSNDQGGAPNADVFEIDVSNNGGSSWVSVETVGPTGPETTGGWIQHAFRIDDFLTPTSTMRLRFQASDLGTGSIVEAAVDDIEGTDLGPSGGGPDCNSNGVPDSQDISNGTSQDCNSNSIPDECDVDSGASLDCNSNGVPDECETDCNANGVPDDCDITSGTSADCNSNSVPDECDIAAGTSADCNSNSVPDECDIASGTSLDCNSNGTPDDCETDCNANGVPDDCDITAGTSQDCNSNAVPDECDITAGTSLDCNSNGTPDECETDCNTNGVPDDCDITSGTSQDCNSNSVPDECDIAAGTSLDCNSNGTPDECEVDCNSNGVPDSCDISSGTSEDCNANGVPDECDLGSGTSLDCNANGTPDECETDCNSNGVPDDCDITSGTSQDCNSNSVPDECDITAGTSLDCNSNGTPDECETDCNANGVPDDCDIAAGTSADCNSNSVPDECDISAGTSLDCNSNGTPDECETDCNANGVPDDCDIAGGTSADCNSNSIPDECDISAGTSLDCNSNGTPDECETDCNANGVPDDCDIAAGTSEDCNSNSIPDECDISAGTSLDCNSNGTPDECETDCNANGVPDDCDIAAGTSEDCNSNAIPDECDIAGGTSADTDGNGIPDECECLGTTYCSTSPNSVGSGALISYSGTAGIAANDLVLEADGAPTAQFGIFYYGPNQIQVPFGDGFRCVGGGVFRLPVIQTDGLGHADFAVDYGNLPVGGDVAAGENWNFQFWYRDPAGPGGTGFNLSDGLSLTFCD